MPKDTANILKAAILTALPIEYRAVRSYLTHIQEEIHPAGTIYEQGTFVGYHHTWEIAIVQIGMGNTGASFEADRIINHFYPHVVLFVGIAGGLKDVRLGDVVAVTKVYAYEAGKASIIFQPRPEVGNTTYAMEQRARIESTRTDWLDRLSSSNRQLPNPMPRVFIGPIAAGEKVIASTRSQERQFLLRNYGDALAVEMEGYGFLKAMHANQHVNAMIIRGISDLIDGKSEIDATNFQEVAALHASSFAFELLAKHVITEQNRSPVTRTNPPGDAHPSNSSQATPLEQFNNYGSMQGTILGGSNNTVIFQPPPKDTLVEGKTYLRRGHISLSNGDYTAATQYLACAMQLLDEEKAPKECAQVNYLLAIAHLNGERPLSITLQVWQRVEELLQAAIVLYPLYSYFYTFALFKQDFVTNGWKKLQYTRDIQSLLEEAEHTLSMILDDENIQLLWKCQHILMQETQE